MPSVDTAKMPISRSTRVDLPEPCSGRFIIGLDQHHGEGADRGTAVRSTSRMMMA